MKEILTLDTHLLPNKDFIRIHECGTLKFFGNKE